MSTLTPTASSNFNSQNQSTLLSTYDDNGNLKTASGYSTTFDPEGRLLTITLNGQATTYTYDGEGNRIMKQIVTPLSQNQTSVVTTAYVYDAFGNLAAEYDMATANATVPGAVSSLCGTSTTCYVTVDQLGSTRLVTDSNGAAQRRYDYLPSGEEIPNTLGGRSAVACYQYQPTRPRRRPPGSTETGSIRSSRVRCGITSGLDYMNARYYSPAQGRFVSPDPANAGADPAESADVEWLLVRRKQPDDNDRSFGGRMVFCAGGSCCWNLRWTRGPPAGCTLLFKDLRILRTASRRLLSAGFLA